MEITGKVFVVTGGGNGIGREVVLALLSKGGKVAAIDLNEAGLAETATLAAAGDRLTTHAVNITDRPANAGAFGSPPSVFVSACACLNSTGTIASSPSASMR